jgi:hypothetical protein
MIKFDESNKIKVFELGDEGSTLTIYRFINNKDELFFHTINGSAYDDDEIGVSTTRSKYSFTIIEQLLILSKKIDHLFGLHPLYVAPEYVDLTIILLKDAQKSKGTAISKMSWAEVLGVNENELEME